MFYRLFIFQNVIELEDVTTTNLQSENSTQQQIHNEHIHVPLQATSPSTEEPVSPGTPTPNDDYTPVDMRTLSWEVARDDVKAEKIIGKGAFGQVAKGMARNLLFRSEATSVAIKMVKGKVYFFSYALSRSTDHHRLVVSIRPRAKGLQQAEVLCKE